MRLGPLKGVVDMGAAVSIIDAKLLRGRKGIRTTVSNKVLVGTNGERIRLIGEAKVVINYKGMIVDLDLLVVRDVPVPLLLGRDWIKVTGACIGFNGAGLFVDVGYSTETRGGHMHETRCCTEDHAESTLELEETELTDKQSRTEEGNCGAVTGQDDKDDGTYGTGTEPDECVERAGVTVRDILPGFETKIRGPQNAIGESAVRSSKRRKEQTDGFDQRTNWRQLTDGRMDHSDLVSHFEVRQAVWAIPPASNYFDCGGEGERSGSQHVFKPWDPGGMALNDVPANNRISATD